MSEQKDKDLRGAVIQACLTLSSTGLTHGTSGNVSARRSANDFFISPSGVPYESMTFSDIPLVVDSGLWYGQHNPSSEWRFHRDIYRNRPDIGAVVHTHSQCATALASTGEGIPAFHYMVAVAGGADIRCAPYATFGSQELSDYAVEALTDRKACLLSNHGVIALGDTLERALSLAGEVENLAAQYLAACQFGEPTILNQVEMERVLKKFRTYGRNEVSGDDGDFKFAGKDIPKNAPKS